LLRLWPNIAIHGIRLLFSGVLRKYLLFLLDWGVPPIVNLLEAISHLLEFLLVPINIHLGLLLQLTRIVHALPRVVIRKVDVRSLVADAAEVGRRLILIL
jgi:hypothetical protein